MAESVLTMYNYLLDTSDPRTKNWFLCGSIVPCIILTALYLGFVALGPRWMQSRQPYSLANLMIIYNLSLVALSLYMFIEILFGAIEAGYGLGCVPYAVHPSEGRLVSALWWYYFSKVVEFLDTVFMVLRKKNSQITFLHVYHHSSMFVIWYFVIKVAPQGLAFFGPLLNSGVHVWMYLYYGLALFPSLRNRLWWKRYLTNVQMVQFILTLVHVTYALVIKCNYPFSIALTEFLYMISMLVLFSNFYRKSYGSSRTKTILDKKKEDSSNGVFVLNGPLQGQGDRKLD